MSFFVFLHDHQNKIHRDKEYKLNDQETLEQLMEEISSDFAIESKNQELFIRIDKLRGLNKTINELGIRDATNKHRLLTNWSRFCELYENAQKLKPNDYRISGNVDKASEQLKLIESSKFFLTYPGLGSTVDDFSDKFAHYLDADNKYIKYAAKDYFSKLFNDNPENPQVEIQCRPKEKSGAQGGVICEVMKSGVALGMFHIKTHLGIASRSSNHQSADLRELFVYRLMELITVGPNVHFLPNVHHSSFGLYIATKDVPNFRQGNHVTIHKEQRLQIDLLRRILYLTDLHSANFGLDGKKRLWIVDFKVDRHTKSADVQEYLQGDKTECIQIGKDSFELWNLTKMVDEADIRIGNQKQLFQDKRIMLQASKNYADYLSQIKMNISAFAILFAQE